MLKAIKSIYLIGSCARNEECIHSSYMDLLIFSCIDVPGKAMFMASPGTKIIVLPLPINGLLIDPITCNLSKVYTIRLRREPKKLIYGSPIKFKDIDIGSLNPEDYKDYAFNLALRIRASKRMNIPRYTCKVLYELLWFILLTEQKKAIEYTFTNILNNIRKSSVHAEYVDVIEYCYDILKCSIEGYKWLSKVTSTLSFIYSRYLSKYLSNELRVMLKL